MLVDAIVLKERSPALLILRSTEAGNVFELIERQPGLPEMEFISVVQKRRAMGSQQG